MDKELVNELKQICGAENVSDSPVDANGYQIPRLSVLPELFIAPSVVVVPDSTEKISRVIRLANKYRVPVSARGQATNFDGANALLEGGILLDMSFMNNIEKIDEDNMVVIAEAGCTTNELFTALDERGVAFPVRPWFDPHMEIGSYISTNGTGDYANFFGPAAQNVVGLEVVLPTGQIVKPGSWAFPYGYGAWNRFPGGPDLLGLFTGSIGTLGIITKVALRLITKRNHIWYRAFGWPRENADKMAKAVYQYFRYGVHNISLHNYWVYSTLINANLVEWPKGRDAYFTANLMQVGESEEELELKARDITRISTENAGLDLGENVCKIAQGPPHYLINLTVFHRQGNSGLLREKGIVTGLTSGKARCFYCYIPVLRFPDFWQLLEDLARKYGFLNAERGPQLYCWGVPPCALNPFPIVPFVMDDPDERMRSNKFYQDLQYHLLKQGGNPYCIGAIWPKEALVNQGAAYDLIRKLKETLDPNNILNPGHI